MLGVYIYLVYATHIHLLFYEKIGCTRYMYKLSIYSAYAPTNKPFDYRDIFSCRCTFAIGSCSGSVYMFGICTAYTPHIRCMRSLKLNVATDAYSVWAKV